MKINQTNQDLINHLREQIQFLISSCESFDRGMKIEAKRLATSIRVLVHDTSNSISLLKQLNCKDIHFYNTALPPFPGNLLPHMGLMSFRNGEYIAPLDNRVPNNPWVQFDTWWTGIIVIDDKKNTFTRKDLVLSVANKDGGAHVDPELNESYAELSRENSMGWKRISNGVEIGGVPNPELVSIRQIAHEMLRTLQNLSPELF